jgi:hypothetical protein
LSTQLAGSALGFDADCTSFGGGFGTGSTLGLFGGLFYGEGEAALGAKGAERIAGDVKGFIGPGGHRNIPSDWVTRPSRGGRGQRYWDPANPKGNYIRIEEDAINGRHVHVTSGGKQVLHGGDRHIPFDVWDSWSSFGAP